MTAMVVDFALLFHARFGLETPLYGQWRSSSNQPWSKQAKRNDADSEEDHNEIISLVRTNKVVGPTLSGTTKSGHSYSVVPNVRPMS